MEVMALEDFVLVFVLEDLVLNQKEKKLIKGLAKD